MLLDHLAVAGSTLEEASAAVEDALGVPLQTGGKHAHFGTHNRLLGLAGGLYLEAIAIDPKAATPARPRWFDLDRFAGRARLTNWICRTDDLAGMLAALPVDAGQTVSLARGDLRWQMAVPPTGVLPFENGFPALIEWEGNLHPAAMLQDQGCSLRRFAVSHPRADELRTLLRPHLDDSRIAFEAGPLAMEAEFDTPHGRRVLS